MPNGFSGRPATRYLDMVSQGHTRAVNSMKQATASASDAMAQASTDISRASTDGRAQSVALMAQLPSDAPAQPQPQARFQMPRERAVRALPFPAEEAKNESFTPRRVGGGGSGGRENIAVSQPEYESVSRLVGQLDDKIGECLYRASMDIEDICNTIFIMPSVTPRCRDISDRVKNSMGQFRSLTEDAALRVRNFARDMTSIG